MSVQAMTRKNRAGARLFPNLARMNLWVTARVWLISRFFATHSAIEPG
jgi:hypothetical protein